jgi:tetraacyldisaccharide 4'-kinase
MNLSPPPAPRSPWQRLYQAVHRRRRQRAKSRAQRLPRPVFSIGNLHLGGTGKTPLTAAVASHLLRRGLEVAILSRGYGRAKGGVRVVSQGEGPLLGPSLAGDEPVLLAGLVPGAAVVVGADRHRAGQHALLRLDRSPDLFLLDDGFSHVGLYRDLDILAFPASDPFGGGRLLPSGRLREPLEAARWADAVVLSGVPETATDLTLGDQLAAGLRAYGFAGPGFLCHTHIAPATRVDGTLIAPGSKVVLVSAIARPAGFEESALASGFHIATHLRFRDHHAYPDATLRIIRTAFRTAAADLVLVTGKDRVKLQGRLDLPLAELPVRAEPEPSFFNWLDSAVERLVERSAQRTRGPWPTKERP